MSQWDKLIAAILAEDQKLRFEDLRKALIRFGYTQTQPGGGSSHYTFPEARLSANHDTEALAAEKGLYRNGRGSHPRRTGGHIP